MYFCCSFSARLRRDMKMDFLKGMGKLVLAGLLLAGCSKPAGPLANGSVSALADRALDSMFVNNAYAKKILREGMAGCSDSLDYYQLLTTYGKVCYAAGEDDSVYRIGQKGLRFCQSAVTSDGVNALASAVYNMLGNVWTMRSVPDSALYCYQQAYRYGLKGSPASVWPDLCINLADANVHSGNLGQAAYYYRHALFLCDSLGLPDSNRFPIYYGLGQVYCDLRDFQLCDQYYNLAEPYVGQMTPYEKFVYLNNRGNSYYFRKDYQTALTYMRNAYRLADSLKMPLEQNLSRINLGELYQLSGQLDSSRYVLSLCRPYFEQLDNYTALYYIDVQSIGLAVRQGNLAQAAELIRKTFIPADRHVDPNIVHIRNHYVQRYYEKTGDYRNAYHYLQDDIRLQDSIRSKEVMMRVGELDMRYRQDTLVLRKELLIERQAGEMEALHLKVILWSVGCVLLLVVLVLLFWSFRKHRALLQARHLNQMTRLRMENIRNHISPHFTFNVLNRELSSLKDRGVEYDGLLNLVQLLRRSLELTEQLSVTLQEELDFVQTYIALERKRLGEDFHLTLQIPAEVDPKQIRIPSMVLLTAVENALKHGLAGLEREKLLVINLTEERSGIRITVTDNGRGFTAGVMSPTRGTGTGLKVLYQTFQLLNHKNKTDKIEFSIRSVNPATDAFESGTVVSVYVPYKYDYEL